VSQGQVVFSREGAVGQILFDNPGSLNALSFAMWRRLGELCGELAQDRSLRVVVLRGAGGEAFLAGTQVEEFLDFDSGQDPGARGVAYEAEMDGHVGAVESLPQTTIAAVEGWAVGGGLALALACDIRIATPESRFGAPVGRTIGNCLSARDHARMAAHLGMAQAKRMLLLGEVLPARELAALGVLQAVVEPEAFEETLRATCVRAAENAPLTSQASKAALRRILYANLPDTADLTAMVYASADFRAGVRKFLDKEKRDWTGA
jgi:enoyl-CoA hydratase/carnithine racemase